MIAYNNNWLYNNYVRGQADEALHEHCITRGEHDAIYKAKEVGFYTPNFFVRIGLAVLTMVITAFTLGLLALMFESGHSFSFLVIFVGVICYIAAELFVRSKRHYNSGIDNMLVWLAALLVWCGFLMKSHTDSTLSFIALILCTALAVRFADTILSIAATMALLCFVFYSYQHTWVLAKNTTPFLMILVSGALYIASSRPIRQGSMLLYRYCIRCVNIVSPLALYASGNYYLVKELSNEMFHLNLRIEDPLPLGWFFWAWTFLIPVIYIGLGIRNKNITLIRTGIPLIAASVMTFRYYYSILSPEMAMLSGGAILFIVSYSLINGLRVPKKGFTFKPETYTPDTPDVGRLLTNEFIGKATGGTGNSHGSSGW